jgi:nicotinamidase-related amidase
LAQTSAEAARRSADSVHEGAVTPVASEEALLVVDPQVDFCPGGALAVPRGDRIFDAVNRAMREHPLVVASRDWHPAGHVSFSTRGGPWPPHCVSHTPGAAFHKALDQDRIAHVVDKGSDPDSEAYSAFAGTDLEVWLRARGVKCLYVAGLATDYCVKQSVLDALRLGFEVIVLEDAIAAVDVRPGDGDKALEEMVAAGAKLATTG